jgi:hypothetical protein
MKDVLAIIAGVLGMLLIFSFLFVFPFTGLYYGYSDGERTGDIYKFSKKGLIWKSWEGEMYLGGMVDNGNGGLQMEKFYFSIPQIDEQAKSELISKIQKCTKERKHCTIKYVEWFVGNYAINSSYEVVGVEEN